MLNPIRVWVLIPYLAVQPLLTQAVPVDVNSDGEVGPEEVIDLSQNWKGPALSTGGLQPWQINGATIFYNAGSVGIGTSSPSAKFQVNDGRIRVADTATGNRWDMFQHDSGNLFFIEQNATYRNFMESPRRWDFIIAPKQIIQF